MIKITVILILLLLSGCAAGPVSLKKIVSPAKAAYSQADAYFQNKDYAAAILAYEKFIKDYPQNNLIPGAYLGIGWSYYLKGQHQEALEALAKVRAQDANLKAWVDKLQQECKKNAPQTQGPSASSTLFNIPAFTNQDRIKIEGTAPEGGKVAINGQEAQINNGIFQEEIILKEGENILNILLTDKEGKTETKETKTTLDKTKPQIKVTRAELDDFGYAQIEGITKAGGQITAEGELLETGPDGRFSGRIKSPRNKQIEFLAKDLAGNINKEIFADNDYPQKPTGLRLRSVSGTNAEIEWNSNREQDLKGYNVYYSLAGEFSDKKNNREVISKTTYTVTDMRSAKTYQVYIKAVDKMANESEPSTTVLTVVIP